MARQSTRRRAKRFELLTTEDLERLPGGDAFTYLASPYSDSQVEVMERRYVEARRACAYLLAERVWTYSPIVHCHELANAHKLPVDFEFWREYNFTMLRAAGFMVVLSLPGWGASKGVQGEIKYAQELNKSVTLLEPLGEHRYSWGALTKGNEG
jgi:hypothetical protein